MISSVEEKRAVRLREAQAGEGTLIRGISFGLCVLFLLAAMVCSALYAWASYSIGKQGLRDGRRPLEGAVEVRGTRIISVGMAISRAALARELDAAGFTAAAGGDNVGTYSLVGDSVVQLQCAAGLMQVHFRGRQIDRIQDAKNEDVEALQIPSPVLFRMHHATEDLGRVFSQREFYIEEEELKGSVLPDVLLPTEDRAYTTHGGVAPKSILAAGLDTLRGAKMRGAGTVPEQLGRTLIWPDENIGQQSKLHKTARKVLEFFLASALERRFSKDDILRFYAESVDVGTIETAAGQRHQVRGFKALAFYLYGVRDMRKLTIAQAAAMVSLLTRPNYYLAHLDELRSRRDLVVLKNFAQQHPEQAAAARAAMKEPLGFVPVADDGETKEFYGFFLDSWRASPDFQNDVRGAETLNLSVDPILQDAAATALRGEILELRRRGVPDVEGAIVAMDPETGQVRALAGADRFPALDAARQSYRTGSAAKPFYYARALEEGSVNGEPLTAVTPLNLADCAIGVWQPNDGESGGYLSTRAALAKSSDCGAVAVAKGLGLQKACDAIRLALQNHPACNGGPELLGGAAGSEASPLHLAEAYAAFVNGGERVEARFMKTSRKTANRTRLFSPQAAFVATSLMMSVMRNGTGAQALAWSGSPKNGAVAGKTGTSGNGSNKFWLAVVQPRLIVVVMISAGSDKALTEQAGYTGGLIAGKVYGGFVRRSAQVAPYYFGGEFQQPSGVQWLEVDRSRGCLQPGTKNFEIFLFDRVPPACS